MKILMVLTSHDKLGNTGRKTPRRKSFSTVWLSPPKMEMLDKHR